MKSQSTPIYNYEEMQEVKEAWQTKVYVCYGIILVLVLIVANLIIN